MYSWLVLFFRACILHGHLPAKVLLTAILPLIKDRKGDSEDSNNYRSICISSIFLKILDWVILILFSDKLKCDKLQFGYVAESNTELAAWLLIETVSKYLRTGTSCYVLFADCTKAYDLILHSRIFRLLSARNIPAIIKRILLYSYREQLAVVKWDLHTSIKFTIRNGVRQGAVSSPVLFNIYTCEIFDTLRRSKLGARINQQFCGIISYADDLCLIARTRGFLQKMIRMLERFAMNVNITFSTNVVLEKSKTKCMVFHCNSKQHHLVSLKLNGNNLPFTDKYKYLGTQITNSSTILLDDMNAKRGMYINNTYNLGKNLVGWGPRP